MQNSEDLQELRLCLVKRLFRSYIEGKASLEQVLREQAMRFEGLNERLDRVEKLLTLVRDELAYCKKIRNRGGSLSRLNLKRKTVVR